MNKKVLHALKKNDLSLAPVDRETAKKITKISKITGESSWAVINAAIQILEKSMGRKLVVESPDSNLNLRINHFKKYNQITDLRS